MRTAHAFLLTSARWAMASFCLLAACLAQAAPTFVYPLSTSAFVEVKAANLSPGISRNTAGNAPIADAATELSGLSTADASARVDAQGLHASAAVHNASGTGETASARALAGIVNPFYVVPRAGNNDTMALIHIDYHLGGALNDSGCGSCFEFVQAELSVDGVADRLYFLGYHSLGTINNPNGNVNGVDLGGYFEGLVPVNTELYLRGGLYVGVHCQSPPTCDASSLFGSTLGYTGTSIDAVDIVWALTPAAQPGALPEPGTAGLVAAGLALGLLLRRRRDGNAAMADNLRPCDCASPRCTAPAMTSSCWMAPRARWS